MTSKTALLYVPYDSARRDERMGRGPLHLQGHGAAERLRSSGADAYEDVIEAPDGFRTETGTAFALARSIAERVRAVRADGALPIVLGGNCGSALGTVTGLRGGDGSDDAGDDVGVVWLDAHGDFETPETTTSGFFDGMALATLAGRCWTAMTTTIPGFRAVPGARVVLVGARDVSDAEAGGLAWAGVTRVHEDALVRDGAAALAPALDALAARGVKRVYLHVDLDVHDAALAPANSYVAPGGLAPATVRDCVSLVRERFAIAAAALTAFDPAVDPEGQTTAAALELLSLIAR